MRNVGSIVVLIASLVVTCGCGKGDFQQEASAIPSKQPPPRTEASSEPVQARPVLFSRLNIAEEDLGRLLTDEPSPATGDSEAASASPASGLALRESYLMSELVSQ